MFLALREIGRARARFALLISAIGMLVFLILFQQSVQQGLLTSFVGAIENQSAPILVYSVDGQRVIQGSIITPDLEAHVASTDGVAVQGRIGQGTFSVLADGRIGEATILGYEQENLGAPSELVEGRYPAAFGEAVASDADGGDGYGLGDIVVVEPGGLDIVVVGVARDVQLNANPTLFVAYDTYIGAVGAANPDAGEPLPNVVAVQPAAGYEVGQVVDNINAQSLALDALTRSDAAANTPGVAQVQQSFRIIFLLYGLVIPFVTGLFFLIVTFQKAGSLTLLRAIGAPASRLVGSMLAQAAIITGLGYLVGLAFYVPVSQIRLGGIPLRFETNAVVFWAVVLLILGLGSSLFAAQRVLRIDPIEATTGGGQR